MYFPIIDALKENFMAKIPSIVTKWLTDNVVPVGSAVVVDKSLSISGASADAKVTGDKISDLKSELNNVIEDSYDTTTKVVYSSSTGWRLNESDGLCSEDPAYKLIKYAVTEGDLLKIVSDDRFQFQSTVSVPSTGTSTRIGKTYGDGIAYVTVPNGATFLILSTPVENSIAVAYGLTELKSDLANLKSATSFFLDLEQTQGELVYSGWRLKEDGTRTGDSNFNIYAVRCGVMGDDIFAYVPKQEGATAYYQFQDTKYVNTDTSVAIGSVGTEPICGKLTVPTVAGDYIYLLYNVRNTVTNAGVYTSGIKRDIESQTKQLDYLNEVLTNNVNHKLLNARKTPHCITLLHFSDIHADVEALNRIVNYANSYGDNIDDIICTGDMVANTYGSITSWWNPNIMTCIGNHDSASYSNGAYNWTALSMADRDNYYISPFENNWDVTHTSGKSYYYKDYSSHYLRLIVMDGMLYNDNGAEATEQTSWLADLLSDAIPKYYRVLIAIHSPHGGATAKDCSFSKYNEVTMPTNPDCNTPQIVVDTVNNAIASGLMFAGYICGHTHQDNIWDAENDGKQNMYTVTCANTKQQAQWANSDQYRDASNDAFNIITVDTQNNVVKIIRGGGADIDNRMRTRKAICINFITGEVVGEVN